MASFKTPTFQERTELARQAKQKALDQLKAKPPIDPAVLAERQAARLAREEAAAVARRAKAEAFQAAKAEKLAEAAARAAAIEAQPKLTEADQKAARDARYAARKKRKN
jgi:Family of unknown function (DUF6481)